MEQFNYKYIMNSYLYRMAPITNGTNYPNYQKVDADGRGEVCAGSITMFGVMAEITVDTENEKFYTQKIDLK